MISVLSILGTRPEAIKLSPILKEFNRRPSEFASIVCVTAQHRQLLDQTLAALEITPDHDLDIMTAGQTLSEITARATVGLSNVIQACQPDLVMVQGDTTTAFCGALSAYYQQRPVAHIEAGLRTGNRYSPFPEEMNRAMVGRLATYHFAPTDDAQRALIAEGIQPESIFVTGNTVIDSLFWMRDRVRDRPPAIASALGPHIVGRQLVVVTGHRRESFGKAFEEICAAIRTLADRFPQSLFVYPVHLNPNVREPVNRILGDHTGIRLLEPVSYSDFVWLLVNASIVLTDSGGVQEEAPALGKPVFVMRETTERPEGLRAGNARLTGVTREQIVNAVAEVLGDDGKRRAMTTPTTVYGDGNAALRIADILAVPSGQQLNSTRSSHRWQTF